MVDKKDTGWKNHEHEFKKHGFELKPYAGHIILGYPVHFPKSFEYLLLNSTADDILSKKIFFDLNDRSDYKERFLSDLTMSNQHGFIPVYENRLPISERVVITDHTTIEMPLFSKAEFQTNDVSIRAIKNIILKFCLAVKTTNMQAQNLRLDLEPFSNLSTKSSIKFDLYVVQYETFNEIEKQVVLVHQPDSYRGMYNSIDQVKY